MPVLVDASHNTCKEEEQELDGKRRRLFVHRKGATRAFGASRPAAGFRRQHGDDVGDHRRAAPASGARLRLVLPRRGRQMIRHQALKHWYGRQVADELRQRGININSAASPRRRRAQGQHRRGEAAHTAGLSRKVASLEPVICIKG